MGGICFGKVHYWDNPPRETRSRIHTGDIERTYSSCLRSPFRCTSTRRQYSTSVENADDHQAQEGGSGLVPPTTYDGNGMENGRGSSVGVYPSRGGHERTMADVTRLRLICSEINPLSDDVTLTFPRSCKIGHVDQLCPTLMDEKKVISTETSTRTTWVHSPLSLMAPCTIPLKPYTGCLRLHTRLPRVMVTRGLSYRKEEVEDHSGSPWQVGADSGKE